MLNTKFIYVNKDSFKKLNWIISFKFLIEFVYFFLILPNFSMFESNFNGTKYILSWVLVVVSFICMNQIIRESEKKISTMLLYLIYLFSYIPGTSLWALTNASNDFFLAFNVYWFLIFILMLVYSKLKFTHAKPIINKEFKHNIFLLIIILSTLYGLYYSYTYSGFRIHLDLSTVYDIRGADSHASTIEGLLYHIISVLIFPVYANYFYRKRKLFGFATAVFMQFLMFSVEGHKFYLFIIPIGLVASHIYNEKFYLLVPKLSSLLITIGLMEQVFRGSHSINSFFVRRTLFIPAWLDQTYYNFFLENPPTYFGQDKIITRLGVDSPYPQAVSRVIGEIYMDGANANTGLFGDAISNLGIYATFIFPLLFLILMVLLDMITNKVSNKYLMTLLVSLFMAIINTEMSGIFYNFAIPMLFLFAFIDFGHERETLRYNNPIFHDMKKGVLYEIINRF